MKADYEDFIEVDRMINEGLGGGYIDSNLKEKQLKTIDLVGNQNEFYK